MSNNRGYNKESTNKRKKMLKTDEKHKVLQSVKLISDGDEVVADELKLNNIIKQYLPALNKYTNKWRNHSHYADIYQSAIEGLIKGVRTYNNNKNIKEVTWLINNIKWAVGAYTNTKLYPVNYSYERSCGRKIIHTNIEDAYWVAAKNIDINTNIYIDELLNKLDKTSKDILIDKYFNGYTYDMLMEKYNLTNNNLKWVLDKALSHMRDIG